MELKNRAKFYYTDKNKNCAVAMLLASNDVYGLGFDDSDAEFVVGFGGGLGCGKLCGALAGSIAVLGKMFSKRENFRKMCADFTKIFHKGLGCDSIDCSVLCPKYKTEDRRCEEVVLICADLLEKFISENK